jgi:hypothetical protein
MDAIGHAQFPRQFFQHRAILAFADQREPGLGQLRHRLYGKGLALARDERADADKQRFIGRQLQPGPKHRAGPSAGRTTTVDAGPVEPDLAGIDAKRGDIGPDGLRNSQQSRCPLRGLDNLFAAIPQSLSNNGYPHRVP